MAKVFIVGVKVKTTKGKAAEELPTTQVKVQGAEEGASCAGQKGQTDIRGFCGAKHME